jgi:hypothetical protein
MSSLKPIKTKVKGQKKSRYNAEFVKKILKGQKVIAKGKGVSIKTEDFWR